MPAVFGRPAQQRISLGSPVTEWSFFPLFDTVLSLPLELYALTAKYHVPEVRPVTV